MVGEFPEFEPYLHIQQQLLAHIFGCADVVFDFELKTRNDIIPNDVETWRGCGQNLNLRLVTKAEPKPASWDIPHGKLKVFMDTLRRHQGPNDLPVAGMISTFSRAPPETHKMLERDNIYVITFTKRGEISSGFAPEQTRL